MTKTTRIFTRFRSETSRSFATDSRTLTVPDVVPTLKEIILSGSQTLNGTPFYDDSPDDGYKRLIIQRAPLESILNAQLGGFDEDTEHSETNENKEPSKLVENKVEPAPSGETD